MKAKKYVASLLVLMVCLVTSVAFASSGKFKILDAIAAARAEVPVTATLLGYQEDGQELEVMFQDDETFEQYYVEVTLATSKVQGIDIKGATFVLGSTVVNKTPEDIKEALLVVYPTAKNIVITSEYDMNNMYYEAEFRTEKFKGEAKFNPATGAMLERELKYY